jgi:hypothetical protein
MALGTIEKLFSGRGLDIKLTERQSEAMLKWAAQAKQAAIESDREMHGPDRGTFVIPFVILE